MVYSQELLISHIPIFLAHRKSAFAFVTYKNNKSASRAVVAEVVDILSQLH